MKIRKKKIAGGLFVVIVALYISQCAIRDEKFSQSNPYDPGGDNWTVNIPPSITADFSSKPLWYDYDFQKDAGTIRGSITVYDKNGKYDTLTFTGLFGLSSGSLDTIFTITIHDTILDESLFFQDLKLNTTYYYKFIAVDTWDSAGVVSGNFTTPDGRPPEQVDSIGTTSSSLYVRVDWLGKDVNIRYKLYSSNLKEGPFVTLLDSTIFGPTVYYDDYVDDYQVYYYVVATVNGYGECRSKKVVIGYKYSTSISYPSSVSASKGSYSTYIRVTWYSVYSAAKYYIHRGRSAATAYTIIDSITSSTTTYRDTMQDTSTQFYYRISAANSKGERGRPSTDCDYGYIDRLNSPYSVSATDGTYESHIYISWSSVSGAAGYNIYRSLTYSGVYTLIDSAKSTYYYDSVKTMDTYYYKIAAYDAFGRVGTLSSYNAGYIKRTLDRPTSVTASRGTYEDYISVTWSAVTGATGYYIHRSLTNILDSFTVIDSTSSTFYNDSVPTADNYYYAVSAYDSLGRASQMSSTYYGYITRLSTPSISSISKGTYYTHIAMSWSAITGADGYLIYRSDSGSAGQYLFIDSTISTGYNDSSLNDQEYHYYKLAAYNNKGKVSALSSYQYGYLKPFSYPTNIVVSKFLYKDRLIITWDEVPVATGYNVYRSTTSSGTFTKIASVTENSYIDSTLGNQNYYYYKISTLNGSTESTLSSYVQGYKLIPPPGFSVKGYSGYIRLSWNSNSNLAGYYIYRSSDQIDFLRIAILSSGSTSYYSDTVQDFRTYFYKVSSFSTEDESDFTGVDSAQKLPSIPQNLTANSYPTHVALRWGFSVGAESYNVYRGTNTSATSLIGNTTDTTYNDSLTVSTKYYFRVTAVNNGGESSKSNYVYAGIIAKPSTPTNFTSTNSPLHIYLSWAINTNEQVDGYYLYRSDSDTGTYAKIKTLTGTTCYDTVMDSRIYYYKLSAYNIAGESNQTSYITGQRLKPATPATVSIQSEQYYTHLPVSWSSSVGAEGYNVYRALADSGYAKVHSTAQLFYNDSTVGADTIYYYKISAYSIIGESPLSYYVSGKKLSQRSVPQEEISIGKAKIESIITPESNDR